MAAASEEPGGIVDRVKARVAARRRERAATKGQGAGRLLYILVATLLALVITFGAALVLLFSDPDGKQVSLTQLSQLAAGGRVESAVFLDEDSQVVANVRSTEEATAARGADKKAAAASVQVPGVPDGALTVRTAYPNNGATTNSTIQLLQGSGATVEVDPQAGQARLRAFTTFLLPVLILANLFGLLFVGKGSGGGAIGEVTNFGRVDDGSRTGGSSITFADVGGAEEAVTELAEVRDYLKDPAKYKALGAAPPKGVLLFGPPGTGKTLLAKAVAGEAGVPFFSVAGAEFVESLVGVGAARIRDLFRRVNAVAPAIVFIDELDAAGRKRGSGGGGGGSDEREQTLNQLLVEMDGFDVTTGVVVIAATNRPDILDPALMRPGRFDRHITVERPDATGRERILKIHAGKKPLSKDVDLNRIASRTPGFTGADLASVVNEAALLTIRGKGTTITMKQFEEAVVRVLEGPQRRGQVLTAEERTRAAYHEIGHVVVAATLGRHEDVHRVTVLGRGRTIAAATFADSEATILTKSALHAQLVATLGGIAAENLVLGEGSTGGEQDLEHATTLARDMVTRYGMADEVGPVRLQVKAGEGFLGDDTALIGLSSETQRAVEEAVRRLITEAQSEATAILRAHRRELDTLATRLDAEETLEDEVLQDALAPLLQAIESGTTTAAAPARRRAVRTAAAASTPTRTKARATAKS
ncbi:MAG: ATP-dependent zinc metalloprotease FtsH [Actinobacteria bacterium]|nr:ATP-dependent zinc metalloprotease FtsH [Actinomycetota bacterium]MCA1720335.1 ATP-dependent zinc metalloprotease FtsH [Actinomycetota bacterium]